MSDGSFAVRARYVLPMDRPALRDGVVHVRGHLIESVSSGTADDVIDLGDVALLPGFVNPHTHLEFSELVAPLGRQSIAFPQWIGEVIRWRLSRLELADTDWRTEPIRRGIVESSGHGVMAVGDIATLPWNSLPYGSMMGVAFVELLGLADDRQHVLMQAARDVVDGGSDRSALFQIGLSPHAPYSVRPSLVESLVRLSARSHAPVAMHLAETVEELELLQSHSGPLVEFLESLGAWDSSAIPTGLRPMDYLEMLSTAHRALVIHGNFLTDDEIAFVGGHREKMSVVYCPTTHTYFGRDRYPLPEMLDADVNVAIGTDSRASNDDLDLFRELRLVASQYPEVPSATVLRLGTLASARALGMEDLLGSLAPGKLANMIAIPIDGGSDSDPYDRVLHAEATPRIVCQAGVRPAQD